MRSGIKHFPSDNPIHKVQPALAAAIARAQTNHLEQVHPTAGSLIDQVLNGLQLKIKVPRPLYNQPVMNVAETPYRALVEDFTGILLKGGVPATVVGLQAQACARELQLIRAFDNPTAMLLQIEQKVAKIVASLPMTVEDIECGKNPGDVIDPFAISAAQVLMYQGDFEQAVGATVAHKALMIIEDLLGHLHEDVIGGMRGNVRAPEPRGVDQEKLDPAENPFPGADVIQPPYDRHTVLRFHQIKNKTGSAKGGDGKRLGDQLARLRGFYGGEIYYDALIGRTLRGHRSRTAVERAAPGVVVLVGEAAFQVLTGSAIGPELLLRMYQAAFEAVARSSGYSVPAIVAGVVAAFRERAEEHGDYLLETILKDVISGPLEQQDSRHFKPSKARRRTSR